MKDKKARKAIEQLTEFLKLGPPFWKLDTPLYIKTVITDVVNSAVSEKVKQKPAVKTQIIEKNKSMNSKFKQGDKVKHILTNETMLVISKKEGGLDPKYYNEQVVYTNGLPADYFLFSGNYQVMDSKYETRTFPEWQLKKTK